MGLKIYNKDHINEDMNNCPHCDIALVTGNHIYKTEDGEHDVELYLYCDKCGADYS